MAKKRKKVVRRVHLPFPTVNQQYQELSNQIEQHQHEIEAISKSHTHQIALLGNFASHDLKNYIHSIDGIVSTYNASEITDTHLNSISYNLDLMRQTLNNFSKLVRLEGDCNLFELVEAVQILNRGTFAEQNIEFIFDDPQQYINFKIPFMAMLQLLNNLIINAIKALNDVEHKQIHLQTILDDNTLTLTVFDNGVKIPADIQPKIFEYGFSGSGGSGIGLFHARYLCDMYNGQIIYHEANDKKGFIITLPIIKDNA